MEGEVHQRKNEDERSSREESVCEPNDRTNIDSDGKDRSMEKQSTTKYDIESDPDYQLLFVVIKTIIVVMSYYCFQLIFNLFIRPLFVSLEERLGMLVASLTDQWCPPEGCSGSDEETIQAVLENIKKSGKRFW